MGRLTPVAPVTFINVITRHSSSCIVYEVVALSLKLPLICSVSIFIILIPLLRVVWLMVGVFVSCCVAMFISCCCLYSQSQEGETEQAIKPVTIENKPGPVI